MNINVKEFFRYGEIVAGYDIPVLNEREARAGAGILFVGAFLGLTNGVMLGTAVFSEFFVTFFAIDFTIRMIQPRYAPSLLLGRLFVRNQKPEYVGAVQKRFAWMIGILLAYPMFYYLVIDFQPNPLKVLACVICMALLFFESVLGICLGCKIFEWINRKNPKYCPGGVCEVQIKEPVQKFTPVQAVIVVSTLALMSYGTYAYMTKLKTRTHFGQMIKKKIMSNAERKAIADAKYQHDLEDFENDDDF